MATENPPHRKGRPAAELNAERAKLREDPAEYHERLQQAIIVETLTERRNPPRDLAQAWRIATGEYDVDSETAARRGRNLKSWLKRTFAPSMATHLMAAQLGPAQYLAAVADQVEAVKLAPDGTVRLDPDGQPIPDLVTRRRALPLWREALILAGLLGPHQAPDVDQAERNAVAELAQLEKHPNGPHVTNGAAAAVGG